MYSHISQKTAACSDVTTKRQWRHRDTSVDIKFFLTHLKRILFWNHFWRDFQFPSWLWTSFPLNFLSISGRGSHFCQSGWWLRLMCNKIVTYVGDSIGIGIGTETLLGAVEGRNAGADIAEIVVPWRLIERRFGRASLRILWWIL